MDGDHDGWFRTALGVMACYGLALLLVAAWLRWAGRRRRPYR